MLLERHHEDRFRVYASALSSFTPSKDEAKARLRKLDILDTKKAIASVGGTSIDYSWLKGASETYQISSDIKDFILQEVPIVTVDFPNRNLHAFSFDEVSYFDPRFGQSIYKSFEGKPLLADTINKNLKEPKAFTSTRLSVMCRAGTYGRYLFCWAMIGQKIQRWPARSRRDNGVHIVWVHG